MKDPRNKHIQILDQILESSSINSTVDLALSVACIERASNVWD